jgi:hypothetical protein
MSLHAPARVLAPTLLLLVATAALALASAPLALAQSAGDGDGGSGCVLGPLCDLGDVSTWLQQTVEHILADPPERPGRHLRRRHRQLYQRRQLPHAYAGEPRLQQRPRQTLRQGSAYAGGRGPRGGVGAWPRWQAGCRCGLLRLRGATWEPRYAIGPWRWPWQREHAADQGRAAGFPAYAVNSMPS